VEYSVTEVDVVEVREVVEGVSKFWWLWLLLGIAWIAASAIILQFDQASVTTIGVIVGIMFFVVGTQNFAISALTDHLRWMWIIFGVLFWIAGVLALISPENTFVALADMLGFLFLLVGTLWIVSAIAGKPANDLWWVGLIAGILMLILAFWTAGQFFFEKAYILIVFAGIWALMQGITDIVRAFQIRKLGRII
jgi:uncharacterized membrane protein HdeD (DUF308 family)